MHFYKRTIKKQLKSKLTIGIVLKRLMKKKLLKTIITQKIKIDCEKVRLIFLEKYFRVQLNTLMAFERCAKKLLRKAKFEVI